MKATVTLKVTPHELQIIREGLKMLHHVASRLNREEFRGNRLQGYQFDLTLGDNDPRKIAVAAITLVQETGLK